MNSDRWFGAVFLVFSLVLFWSNETLDTPAFDLLGSKFFPRVASLAMIFLSILLLVLGKGSVPKAKEKGRITYRPAIFFVILTAAYFLALEFGLGYRGSTTIYLTLFVFMLSDYRLRALPISLATAVVSTYAFYYFFEKFLQLLLP